MPQPPPLPAFNPYAAPTARVEDAVTQQLVLADRIIRLAAVILDALVFVVAVALIAIVAAVVIGLGSKPTSDANIAGTTMILLAVLTPVVVALIVVNMVLLHRHGQTLGKRWLKIKVVLADGNRCGLARYVFARWLPMVLLGVIPLVGPIIYYLADPLLIFGEERRCLHDYIAGTIVVAA